MSVSSERTKFEHVSLDTNGVPVIVGTNMMVIEIVLKKAAYGWSPEEMYFQHPHLTLGQIYSALAYYWDHQEEPDSDIERMLAFVNQARKIAGQTPLAVRLKSNVLI
jgi:uncharacterized protein (DUF433 family)